MIQFKRGSSENWSKQKTPLADGQPGYDKTRNKIKIGDGKRSWDELPDASGLSAEEILNSEEKAKERFKNDSESTTIISYGTEGPDKNTIGQLYLQYYDAEPEVDYIVDSGVDGIWTYQKFKSGIAKCWGTFEFTTAIQTSVGEHLYQNTTAMSTIEYPITFKKVPTENVTIQSPGGLVWKASKELNTKEHTATYSLIGINKLGTATYRFSYNVEGFWR